VPALWNSYAIPLISVASIGPQFGRANVAYLGVVMKKHPQTGEPSPYSAPLCLLLLLATGLAVKTGAAVHLCQLAQGACS